MTLLLLAAGRLLLGSLFVIGGVRHFFIHPDIVPMMAARGVPFPKQVLLAGSLYEIAAGTALMLGLWVPIAAMALVLFTLAASVMMLNFWDLEGAARQATINGWLTNIAISGGLFLAAAS